MTTEYTLRTFTGSDGDHAIAMYTWLPQAQPKGIVQIIHGMREHMGRYADFAAFLCSQGFIVCGHDHLGHGKTARDPEDFGYFGGDKGCQYLLGDCKRVTRLITREYPELPIFLLGHSMGSFVGRLVILRPPVKLAGFICMGTGGEVKIAAVSRAMLEVLSKLRGERKASAFLNRLVISPAMALRGKQDSGWLSRDTAIVEAFESDPFAEPLFTNRAICDLITLQMAATSPQWARRVDPDLPILLLSGDKDPVGQNGRGVVETSERLKLAGCRDVQCNLYEEARHELLGEINKEEVYFDIYQWIDRHLPEDNIMP
jgi:alpha-beta hydrolase superfamily lysophospholipase